MSLCQYTKRLARHVLSWVLRLIAKHPHSQKIRQVSVSSQFSIIHKRREGSQNRFVRRGRVARTPTGRARGCALDGWTRSVAHGLAWPLRPAVAHPCRMDAAQPLTVGLV